ncbi:PilC/PilY family type IV pilus protein [uncultured Thiodictyon sp.]|uniref:pilus assembly protein n=1 Tax=uncultured Thiodictyon sp. TaxID=1846217 RepID=UPI0025FCC1C1|nr:PilC/PilY family type IV pilus protein [uncultured Thiodictyon sp.]
MNAHFLRHWLTAVLLAVALPNAADDIDLFLQPTPLATENIPNVLILLDNTGNWSQAFTNEIKALVSTFDGLPIDPPVCDGNPSVCTPEAPRFRVGLMLFSETGRGNSNTDGAYVRAAIRPLTTDNKSKYKALINSLDVGSDKSNSGKLGKTMAEAFRYYSGAAPYAGNYKVKTDYTGNIYGAAASNAIYALSGNALTAMNGTQYLSPVLTGSCGRNFIIYISNGAAQDSAADIDAATTELTSAAATASISGATTVIPISPTGSQSNVADEWARFMYQSNRNIITYTLDVNRVTSGQGPGWTALLRSMAGVSNGKYFDVSSSAGVNGSEISNALGKIFSEIQAVNAVFASVSLPVSVSTQGTYLNQVYVGMFRPDGNAYPRWNGNLKQYKLGLVGNTLKLQDADSAAAINANTGFITECARSFWTPASVDSYWTFSPQGGCLAVATSKNSNYPDGNIVEKGAQAYMLRSWSNTYWRNVQTCSATFASCTTLLTFNSSYATQSLLGAASTTERDQLINWEKGQDVDDERVQSWFETMRPSVHGDVLHSRPVALNYSSESSPQIVVFYGGNDGLLRAVNGNRTDSSFNTAAGDELWSFVAPEFYSSIKRLRTNSPQISTVGNTSGGRLPKPYGVDGSVTAYQDSSHTWIYAGMRRGGRVVYALNVTAPASPTLKWKKGCPNQGDDTDCTNGFNGIGQSWSTPHAFKAAGYTNLAIPAPLLIMGGGYDTCEDAAPHTCTSATKGNHIYILDADTGALLKTFDIDRAMAGDILHVPDSSTGLAKWAYAADLGGNLYRLSGATANTPFGTTDPANWTITKIAALGCDTPASCTANRKFMFAPDVVQQNDAYILMIGSGDREKPLSGFTSAYGVSNYFFRVSDKPTVTDWLSSENTENGNCGANLICLNSLLPILTTATPTQASLDTKPKGWYLGLNAHEQVVTSAVTVFGTTTFSSHTPALPVAGSCSSNLGTTRVYNIDFTTAASANGTATTQTNPDGTTTTTTGSRSETVAGGGLPPSPVAGMVRLESGAIVPFVIGGSPTSPLEAKLAKAAVATTRPKGQIYWYIQK